MATDKRETTPVVDFYDKFGKVHRIDANKDVNEVYEATRKCVLPSVSFMIGPQGAGKSVLGKALCEKTNMKQLKFNQFVHENNLGSADDETVTAALIQHLAAQTCPRVLIESFPQSELQAKFFIKNCVQPSRVFVLNCSKDVCQERMFALG
jgi:adenylate kinase family enzyme